MKEEEEEDLLCFTVLSLGFLLLLKHCVRLRKPAGKGKHISSAGLWTPGFLLLQMIAFSDDVLQE